MRKRDKQSDLAKLADAFFKHLGSGDCEHGGLGLDGKRPFGWSDLEGSILDIIKAKPEDEDGCWTREQTEYAADLYGELGGYLKKQWKALKRLAQV